MNPIAMTNENSQVFDSRRGGIILNFDGYSYTTKTNNKRVYPIEQNPIYEDQPELLNEVDPAKLGIPDHIPW